MAQAAFEQSKLINWVMGVSSDRHGLIYRLSSPQILKARYEL